MRHLILGTGGHAKAMGQVLSADNPVCRFLMADNDDDVRPDDVVYIGVGDILTRKRMFEKFRNQVPYHGVQLMGRTWIGPDVVLWENVLVNTGAQIDHDCTIGHHCVIAPGATLCGGVTLGEACFVGAGAIIVEGVTLEPETFVPAGTLVVGPDDFRMPVRMVRYRGADQVDMRQEGGDFFVGA